MSRSMPVDEGLCPLRGPCATVRAAVPGRVPGPCPRTGIPARATPGRLATWTDESAPDESAPSRGPRRPAPGAGLGKNLSCVLKIFVYCRESRAKRQLHHGGGWRCRQPLRVAVAITQDTRGLDLKSTPASWLRPRPNAPPSSRSPEVRSLRRDTRAFPGKAGRLLGE